MRYSEIIEASIDRPWARGDIKKISDQAQSRFDSLKVNFTLLGDIDTAGGTYEVWGDMTPGDARFYAVNDDGVNVGYLAFYKLGLPDPMMMDVKMVFVLPKFQRQGIAAALYRFAMSQGVTIVCDKTLTKGSKAIWQAMINDPAVEVTLMDYDPYDRASVPKETPLTNIRLAFSQKQRRMVARLKP